VIDKFYLLCVIFSGSPDLTLKTCLVYTCFGLNDECVRRACICSFQCL